MPVYGAAHTKPLVASMLGTKSASTQCGFCRGFLLLIGVVLQCAYNET
jgi:hypothetical protein